MIERWPPVYDFADLKEQVKELLEAGTFFDFFYERRVSRDHLLAGNVVSFESPLPLIDASGRAVGKGRVTSWLVLSNTCDLQRSIGKVPFAICAPITSLRREDVELSMLSDLKAYRPYRRFYLPSWSAEMDPLVSFADFTSPATIHRKALSDSGEVVAEMSYKAWVMFHSCLVRFLARDDGRTELRT